MSGRTYRYFAGAPVYPFGFGLSYTRFDYGPVSVAAGREPAASGIRVTTQVRNTGARAVEEVAQLYLNFSKVPGRPRVALRGFQRLSLLPGQTRSATFELSPCDLSSVTPEGVRAVLAGQYRVSVGSGQPGTGVPVQSAPLRIDQSAVLPQ